MAGPVTFRVLFGGEDDARKLFIESGMPTSVEQLALEIKTFFGVMEQFRLQYKDIEFGNEFMNLLSISDIQDRITLKVVYLTCEATTSSPLPPFDETCSIISANPYSTSIDSDTSNDTIILSLVPVEARSCSWPEAFVVPRFSYCAEMLLQKGNDDLSATGTLLSLTPNVRSDILEGLAEQIINYTAYPTDSQFEEVAKALVQTHPCLHEKGTRTGYCGWKHYVKIKMMNFRTKLGRAGHPEVLINSLKNKRKGQGKPAANVKKNGKAEVNFCPSHPRGETMESLELERAALLLEVKKNNNEAVIKEKMHRTFSYRRQDVLQEPPITAIQNRWPALFEVDEVHLEFMRITTVPLMSKFFGQLDKYTDDLMKVFQTKGGSAGQKIRKIMAVTSQNEDINVKRDCILRSLSVYLNEDMETLVKEYMDCESTEFDSGIRQTTMGIYLIRREGAGPEEEPTDVGVVLEGIGLLQNLPSVTHGCVMLFGLIYALNLSYPKDLKCTFEVFQKVLMELDTTKLSPKVQGLKIKLLN